MDIRLVKALADSNRLKIMEILLQRPSCVRALSIKLGLSESAVSQHLKVLNGAGLVEGVRYGYYTHYRANRALLEALKSQLEEMIAIPYLPGRANCDMVEPVGCARKTEIEGGSHEC